MSLRHYLCSVCHGHPAVENAEVVLQIYVHSQLRQYLLLSLYVNEPEKQDLSQSMQYG